MFRFRIDEGNSLNRDVLHYINFVDRCGCSSYDLIEVYWIKAKPNRCIWFCNSHDAIDPFRLFRNCFCNNSQAARSLWLMLIVFYFLLCSWRDTFGYSETSPAHLSNVGAIQWVFNRLNRLIDCICRIVHRFVCICSACVNLLLPASDILDNPFSTPWDQLLL